MEYALLIYGSEAEGAKRTPAEHQAGFKEYGEFTKWLQASGKMKDGRPLEGVGNATTVRVRNGKTSSTDGPFAETKEQLGGFYLVEAKDLDDAIAIAARIPGAKYGCIEVRPILKIPGM
ncbi:MAG TPA: YciI family protein [Candidatus Binataceae bacterium]|nr:YciI family protein [Candidatus Binataceae bacterium]